MKKPLSFAFAAALLMAGCGGLFESAKMFPNLDGTEPFQREGACSRITVTNQVRLSILRGGDSIQDTERTREADLKPIRIDYTIFNSNGHAVHSTGTLTAPADLPYGETVEFEVPFDPAGSPDLLAFPYYKAALTFVAIGDSDDPIEAVYSLDVEKGEGHCGTTYHYTVYNETRDGDKLTNRVGTAKYPDPYDPNARQ